MKRRFFKAEDFRAFDRSKATSEEPTLISARKRVVDEQMKPLHRGIAGVRGLGDIMREQGLESHWSPGHLTNVYWPYSVANGGWVDYLRMGYGKPELLVKELAKRSGVYQALTSAGTYDAMAFHHVTQIQVGITADAWWINWYQDRSAWLEQNNWLAKLNGGSQHRRDFIALVKDLQQYGYALTMYPRQEVAAFEDHPDPASFLESISEHRAKGHDISLSVELRFAPDADENDETILPLLVQQEFGRLLALYRFTSWHPKTNNVLAL